MKQYFIEDNIIILSKQTIDIMLKEKNPSDLIGLYCFYYYTAKWQKTNIIKCSTSYVQKGLAWSKDRVIKSKKVLQKMKLIETRVRKNKEGQVTGWYIKINYIWKKESIRNQRVAQPEGGLSHRVENPDTNALSVNNLNALNVNNKTTPKGVEETPLTNNYGNKEVNQVIVANATTSKKIKGTSSKDELHLNIQDLFVSYRKKFLDKISDKPPIFQWGACERNARAPMRQLGLNKMKELLDKYFASNDDLYKSNAYSLSCFLSQKTLHKLNQLK